MLDDTFHVYDTTLRDGAQQEGLNLSVADKLVIARQLDEFGVGFIEGGWPGAIPKDTEFFRRAASELDLKHAQLAAFGATRRPGVKAADDPLVAALRESGAPVVTLVAKSHDRHVLLALRTTLEENLDMIADTVSHLRAEGQRVFLDAEHFFDGYRSNPDYALEVVRTAVQAGADLVALCDTNGGMMPNELGDVVAAVAGATARPAGHPLPRRHRLRRGQHPGRGRRRGHPRAGHRERVRRAGGQRQPVQRGGRPAAEEGPPGAARRRHQGDEPDRARDQRGHQRRAGHPPAVRGPVRVRAQGRAARLGGQGRPDAVPAHRPRAGRQRHADAGLGHGRPRVGRAEGP